MSRIATTILLALLLVGAQQAALMHEIGHGLAHGAPLAEVFTTAHDSAGTGNAAGKEAGPSYCEKCFQFAHVSGAVFSSSASVGFDAVLAQAVCIGEAANLAADAPPTRSRGPPVLL